LEETTGLNRPMSVGHGKTLFDQNREIGQKVDKLLPLLSLLEDRQTEGADSDPANDPVSLILDLLERVLEAQATQATVLADLDRKLSLVLEKLPAPGR